MATEPSTIDVCVDCVSLLANGEVFDENDNNVTAAHAARIKHEWGDTEMTLGGVGEGDLDDEPEPFFTWSACQGCGSTLGGDREHAAVWVEA